MSKPACLALLASAVAAPVLAQSGAGPGAWSAVVGAATDNRSKSASKSGSDPFVHGLAEWVSADGRFHAGPAFETIRSSTGSRLEVSVGAGYRPQIAGFDLGLGAVHKWQVDADPGADDDSFEFTATASRAIGPASARLQVQYSPDGVGAPFAFTWVEARLGWDLSNAVEATAALGHREQDGGIDYTGWNAGLTWTLSDRADLDLRWYDTSVSDRGTPFDAALVAGVNLYF